MALFKVTKKYWLLLIIAVFIFFLFGYKVGRLLSWPEQIWLGERYVMVDRYDLNTYYDVDGTLYGLSLKDIENDYRGLFEIDFYPSGAVERIGRRLDGGYIRESYYESGSVKTRRNWDYSAEKSEFEAYSEEGGLIEKKEKEGNRSIDDEFNDWQPASYVEYLYFEHSPWNIQANWITAKYAGHIYDYLSCPIPKICLSVMIVAVGSSCLIGLTKIKLLARLWIMAICALAALMMGFAMSWLLFLFHRIQARADLLSDSSACGTVSLYIGVCFALACLILPLIILLFRGKRHPNIQE
ncbi:MAG: hypothetical protein FVQ79_03180 [Planctomycetes bacterium]|nr:hypothetical protein [Planctomycetota bacterium]